MEGTLCKIEEREESVVIKFRMDGQIVYKEIPFINYFYVLMEEFEQVSYIVFPKASKLNIVKDKNGVEYYRIYLKNNYHRNMLKNEIEDAGVQTFEADILAGKRILIDNPQFDLNQEGLRIAFYDIETDDRKPFVKDFKGKIIPSSPVLSIALKEFKEKGDAEVWYIRNTGIDGEEFSHYRKLRRMFLEAKKKHEPTIEIRKKLDEWEESVTKALEIGEKIMLRAYFDHVREFDVVSAWNGNEFDDAYIRVRSKKHGLVYDSLFIVGFDYLESYKKNHYGAVKSFRLDKVAFDELRFELDNENSTLTHPDEIRKLDWRKVTDAIKYFDLFSLYPKIHKEYNIQDVHLLDMMEKKLGFFKLHFVQCREAHCLLIDTLYNSRICDLLVLNESRKRNIVKISKPTPEEVKAREKEIPPGGFTFCYLPGIHWGVRCFDFASHYVNIIRSFNISSENYIRKEMPDLSKVFTPAEEEYIRYCVEVALKFINKSNKLLKKKYEADIEAKRQKIGVESMEQLMWKFINNYDNKIEHGEHECFTPADINYDTRGWNVHPHFVFDNRERAVYPTILDNFIGKRNTAKEALKDIPKMTFQWFETFYYQLGLKLLGNSLYGFTAFRASRDYKIEIPTAITTSARYFTKLCMSELWKHDMKITHGDSVGGDSVITCEDKDWNIETLWEMNQNEVISDRGKEIKKWQGGDVLTCNDDFRNIFMKPLEIIRHEVDKDMYRIRCAGGEIDVTEDHSLIFLRGLGTTLKYEEITPKDILNGEATHILFQKKDHLKRYPSVEGVLCEGGFVIQRVKEIKKLESKPRYVYDISIPGNNKFYASGFLVHNTDSSYCIGDKSTEFLDERFRELIDTTIPIFNTISHNGFNHTISFDYEETYDGMLPIKKKRYYYIKDGKIDGKGGTQTRSDVLQLAKDLQKELLDDIFNKKMDKDAWKQKLLELKKKIQNYKLEEEHLIRISGLGRPIESYGQPVMDGSTGLQKLRKSDGEPMFAPIPANVQVAKKLIAEGENIDVGDKIAFVVLNEKPKIEPITVREYREIQRYDVNYYYTRIVRPVIEVLAVAYPEDVYTHFRDCWMFTDRQIKTLIEKMKDDEDEEDENGGGKE